MNELKSEPKPRRRTTFAVCLARERCQLARIPTVGDTVFRSSATHSQLLLTRGFKQLELQVDAAATAAVAVAATTTELGGAGCCALLTLSRLHLNLELLLRNAQLTKKAASAQTRTRFKSCALSSLCELSSELFNCFLLNPTVSRWLVRPFECSNIHNH